MKKLKVICIKWLQRLAALSLVFLVGALVGYHYHHDVHVSFTVKGATR